MVVTLIGYAALFAPPLFAPLLAQPGLPKQIFTLISQALLPLVLLMLPLAVGIAMLRYRLWDIEVLINRTLVYGTLTVVLVLVYFAGVVLLQQLFQAVTGQGFMNPEGHMFAGWITFSAYEDEDGCTVAQIMVLVRCNDPVYEIGFRLGATHSESRFWQYTLRSVAAHFDVHEAVQTEVVCVDPRVQWSEFWNIWQNAAIRTVLYRMLSPVRWVYKSGRHPFS